MKKHFDLKFSFKGKRNYVQGADIFDNVVDYLKKEFLNIENIKYTAYEMLYHNAILIITDQFKKSDYEVVNSLITFINNEEKFYAIVIEKIQDKIETSIEYSEAVVEQGSKILEEDTIIFQNILNASYTEIIVSMNKYFLNSTIEAEGKWIVTKFDYRKLQDIEDIKEKKIRIILQQNLNNKLTKSMCYIDNQVVGNLYFSLIEKKF